MDQRPSFDGFDRTILSAKTGPKAASETVLGHYLVGIEGNEAGNFVDVGPEPVTIGRDSRQTLVFAADSEVSRLHARVSLVGDAVVVEDLGSTNGTFVNAQRISAPVTLREGNVLRVGRQLLKYERRDREEVARARALQRDLRRASNYVHSVLPAPLESGAVRAEWSFVPSAALGGDAFGYYWLDPGTFVIYLLDVSGHGVGSAMHSVSVMNVLRQRALPGIDFSDPAAVLSSLNERFQMDDHSGMFFTIWYGVYRTEHRRLTYATAGHHAGYLVPPGRDAIEALSVPDLMIGAVAGHTYECGHVEVPAGSSLYLFSDGAFEIVTSGGEQWSLSDFVNHIPAPLLPDTPESTRLYQIVRKAARPGLLDDDFSLVVATFQ